MPLKIPPNNTLIIANPGTGKTTALANRVVELLKAGVPEKDILCITFTNKAAQEMRDKVNTRIKEAGLKDVKAQEISVHTFHSYALDYLQEVEGKYRIIGNNAVRYSIYKSFERNRALNYGNDYIIEEIVPKTENAIRYLKSFGILPMKIDQQKVLPELRRIYEEEEITNVTLEENEKFLGYFVIAFDDYERSKPDGYIDYNDLLIKFVESHDRSKRRYGHVLVDELQDVNDLEARIASKSGDSLFLVGDRKQAIFGFQGGSVGNFARFSAASADRKTLLTNYRSPQQVLDYAKAHFLSNTVDGSYEAELRGLKSERKERGEVQVIVTDNQENACVKKALSLLKSGGDGSVAIITRTNGQLLRMSRILDSKGVEYTSTVSNATSSNARDEVIKFLRGILYDDPERVIAALFTPFSGVPLKEAFAVSEKHSEEALSISEMRKMAPAFFRIRDNCPDVASVRRLFPDVILPVSVSMGRDGFITASALQRNIAEFFETVQRPTRDDLFNYLAVTEESYEPIGRHARLVLTTVHKAKGLEFGDVVYAPKKTRDSFSFIDAVVYAIIKSVTGKDVREELEEEKLRVDFVAFTRTRGSLYIITNAKNQAEYAIDGLSTSVADAADDEPEPVADGYSGAYSMFVAGDYERAKEALKRKDDWLMELIAAYFGDVGKLSYSLVSDSKDPYGFLKNRILKVPRFAAALTIGSRIHEMAESRFRGTLRTEHVAGEDKGYLSNIAAIDRQIKDTYKAQQIAAEESITMPLHDVFAVTDGDGMEFKGTIDAVYRCDDGRYLLVDYKTDRTIDYATEHRKQLAVYKRLYSRHHGVDEGKIDVAIAYLGLKGKINTGRLDFELDAKQPSAVLLKNFEKDIGQFIGYIKDPKAFARTVLDKESDEMLFAAVRKELG